jgi:Asp-tRNA(Asn)/Glu-tRNA(Gln) amidotransferase B subunit
MTNMKTFPQLVTTFMINDFSGLCHKYKTDIPSCGIAPQEFCFLMELLHNETLTRSQVRGILKRRLDATKQI